MKVLVTGASGFVGSSIFRFLKEKGTEVYGIVRKQEDVLSSDYFMLDLREAIPEIGNFDVIIHTAGTIPMPETTYQEFIEGNVTTTGHILDYAKSHQTRRIIFLGTVSSYGEVEEICLRLDSPRKNADIYGLTKYLAQKLIEESGIAYDNLILPGVVGPGCKNVWLEKTAQKMYRNEKITYFNGKNGFNNIVTVQELCDFIYLLLQEDGKSETLLLGNQKSMEVCEILEYMKALMDSASELVDMGERQGGFSIDISKAESCGYVSCDLKEDVEYLCRYIKDYGIKEGEL